MAVDLDALFKKEAFSTIDTERLQLFKQFARDIDGKNTPDIVNMFMKLNKTVSKKKPLSPEEGKAITGAIRESLPDVDKQKFDNIIKLLRPFH